MATAVDSAEPTAAMNGLRILASNHTCRGPIDSSSDDSGGLRGQRQGNLTAPAAAAPRGQHMGRKLDWAREDERDRSRGRNCTRIPNPPRVVAVKAPERRPITCWEESRDQRPGLDVHLR